MSETRINEAQNVEDRGHTAEELATVEQVARIVGSVYGAKSDYTRLATELAQAISFDIFGIVLLHHDHKAVRVTVCQRDELQSRWVAQYHQHPFTDSMLEQLFETTALVVQEYPLGVVGPPAMSGDALSRYPHLRSTCIVPLRTKERVLGTLELGSTLTATYTNSAVQRLIAAVAQVLATSLERTQLEGSAAIQDRQRQALKDVSRALTSTMDLATILTQIVQSVAQALTVATAIITLDQRNASLQLAAQSGLNEAILNSVIRSELVMTEQCILGSTLRNRQSYISNDIGHDERFPASCILYPTLSIRSLLSYPLIIGNTIYGVLLLCSPEPGGFTPLKADIVALFATQVTLALHNGALLEAAQQHNRFQDAIEQLEQTSHSPVYSQEEEYALLMRVREEAQRTFGVSLSNLLRFVSDSILTNTTDAIQTLLHEPRDIAIPTTPYQENVPFFKGENSEKQRLSARQTLLALTQTTQAVIARAGVVSELSNLLMQVQQPARGIKDAWFVVDLAGICVYMNPVAEAFCGVRMTDIENIPASLEHVFATLLPRIRNGEEVSLYLKNIMLDILQKQEMRCAVALELVRPRFAGVLQKATGYENSMAREEGEGGIREQARGGATQLRTMLLESAPSDSHYHLMRHPLHNAQGRPTAYALQVRDITTQVRDEKNKSALLSSVSHDLRTPLTTIKAAVTGLLQEDIPWDEQMRREMLEDIDTETDHLTVLVNALVEMSRIEMGALLLEKEWCDITEVIYETLIKTKRMIAGRKVQTQFSPSLPLLYIDHVQLSRVVYNLVENAARHSPEYTEILIKADVLTEATPTMVRVQIVDSGCGIPTHEHERIFKSFYGLRSHGSGLGLAICKGIIEAHQGRIWVESGDKGSCFIFTLPIDVTSVG